MSFHFGSSLRGMWVRLSGKRLGLTDTAVVAGELPDRTHPFRQQRRLAVPGDSHRHVPSGGVLLGGA